MKFGFIYLLYYVSDNYKFIFFLFIMSTTKKEIKNFNIWKYYNKLNDQDERVTCKKCGKSINCKGKTTSGMIKHLKSLHGIDKNNFHQFNNEHYENNTILPFVKQNFSLSDDLILRLSVLDRIPFNTLVKSKSIRFLFDKVSLVLPKSPNTINKIIENQANSIKSKIKIEIKNFIQENKKFSISFDEYTGINNTKYLILILHLNAKKFWILGLMAIKDVASGENLANMIKKIIGI